jgi:hypothetical protein
VQRLFVEMCGTLKVNRIAGSYQKRQWMRGGTIRMPCGTLGILMEGKSELKKTLPLRSYKK